jgi:2-hydroxycyclohexanecarboxyl-CoA dehydrogenase
MERVGKVLQGKKIFVAGGSGGIGGPIAILLAEAGADVAVTYNSRPERAEQVVAEIRKHGRRGEAYKLDVRSSDEIRAVVAAASEALGSIDVLFTAIGSGAHGFLLKQDAEEWDRAWQADLRSIFHLTRAVLPPMIERKKGRLIYLSSDSAKNGNIGGSVSSAMRGALHSFVHSMAREVARDAITVNAVCAGPTNTDTLDRLRGSTDRHMQDWDKVVSRIPMKRVCEPEEIGGMVVYLASDLGGFVTGQALSVSGGLSMS